jgi:hypothetical protein
VDVQHWGVDVRINGERVLTIESNCLSGIDNISDYAETVRECAHHLLGFIGEGKPENTKELGTPTNTSHHEICAHHVFDASCPFTSFNLNCGPLPCNLAPRKLPA